MDRRNGERAASHRCDEKKDEVDGPERRMNRRDDRGRRLQPHRLSRGSHGNSPDVIQQLFSAILFVLTTASVPNRYVEAGITLEYLLRNMM